MDLPSVENLHEFYHIEYFDRRSLNEIKQMIDNNLYDSQEVALEHLEFMSKLIEKLEKAHSTAKSFGKNNIILGRDIDTIKKTMTILNTIIDKLEN